jgi:hypothetical protein
MAAEYGLDLGAPMTAEQVGDVLIRTAIADGLIAPDDAKFEVPGSSLRSGLLVVVGPESPLPFPDPVETTFGFLPVVGVLFRFDSDYEPIAQRCDMIRLTAAVLSALPGDAFLAYAGETTRLVRLNGQVTISADDPFWVPEVLGFLPPHDVAVLPNL